MGSKMYKKTMNTIHKIRNSVTGELKYCICQKRLPTSSNDVMKISRHNLQLLLKRKSQPFLIKLDLMSTGIEEKPS